MIDSNEKRTYLKGSKTEWNEIKFDNPIYNVSYINISKGY